MITIFIDVDGVVANLIEPWLEDYNRDFSDSLRPADIKAWDISRFVKPEAKQAIFKYIENPAIYDRVKPIPGALETVNYFRALGLRVVYATTIAPGTWGRKYQWLTDHGFITSSRDYIEIGDKGLLRGEILIDDNIDNLSAFQGKRVKFSQPWNSRQWRIGFWQAKGWNQARQIISLIT